MRRALLRARVLAFALAVPALMRLPLRALDRVATPRGAPGGASLDELAPLRAELDGILARLGRRPRTNCLTRGLTRYFFLRRAGAPVALCFGVGRPEAELAGHCWLELDGEPVFEARDPRPVFAETCRLPWGPA